MVFDDSPPLGIRYETKLLAQNKFCLRVGIVNGFSGFIAS